MVLCGSYMYEFSVNKDVNYFFNNGKRRKEVAVGNMRRIYV